MTTEPGPLVRQAMEQHRAGRLLDAEALYRRALERSPDDATALHYLGLLSQQMGRGDALDLLRRSVAANPDSADFHSNLAIALGQLGRTDEAVAALDTAIRLRPDHAEAHNNRGVALDKLGRTDDAAAAFREAVRLKPDYADAHNNLAGVLRKQDRPDDALAHAERATKLAPRHAESHNNLGLVLRRLGRVPEAVAAFRRATDLRPGYVEAYSNLGSALNECGRSEDAVACLRKAIDLRPDYADAHWNLALALLAAGDFDRGWLEYEWRQHLREDYGQRRNFPQPAWNGAPVAGRTVLLLTEQGLGDTLQFVRYAPLVAARGARVILECQAPLRPILQTVPGVDRVIARGEPLPAFDLHARLMSLPGAMGTRLDTVPADVPYVHADPVRVVEWEARLAAAAPGRFRVGIAWQGNKGYAGDRWRSIPLRHFAPLAAVPGVRLFSLQKGEGTEQITAARAGRDAAAVGPSTDPAPAPAFEPFEPFDVFEFVDPPLDQIAGSFTDTAAVMADLDLVVTSDTSLAHLAGALGAPTWVALPHSADWRWLANRPDSPWYAGNPWYPTMRLFRQPSPGDWAAVFARIADALAQEVRARGPAAGDAPLPRVDAVTVPVAPGELIDKITILQIKAERIADPVKVRNVRAELDALLAARDRAIPSSPDLDAAARDLRAANEALWRIEDDLRDCERAGDFGPRFVDLARSVYRTNDRRSELKRRVNDLLGSGMREEKSYAPYLADSAAHPSAPGPTGWTASTPFNTTPVAGE